MKLTLDNFSGLVPVLDNHSLPDSGAQIALNCTTESHKVKLRGSVPEWSPKNNLISNVNGRQYSIVNGILKEDDVSLHMGKPAAVTLQRVDYWTIYGGYTGKSGSPRFQLKSVIGLAGGSSTLNMAGFSLDEETSSFIMYFKQDGAYYPDAGAAAVNMASAENVTLLYNSQEYPLQYPQQISISDNDNGVYATVYVESVVFTTEAPAGAGSGGITINTAHIYVKGKLIKNKSRRNYVVTYWDGRHESPPSDASEEIDVCKGDTVKVTISEYTGGHGTHTPDHEDNSPAYYIYRTGGSLTSAGYYFVGELDPNESASESASGSGSGSEDPMVFKDTTPDYLLQEKLSIVESPQEGMQFLHFFNGALVAAKGSHVCFSEPHILNNWPSKYDYSFPGDVIGLSVSGNSIVVFVENHAPSILRGSEPGSLSQSELTDGFICVAPDSVCTVGDSTYYVAAEGLAMVSSSGQYRIITTQFFSREQWQALNPAAMKCSADNFEIRIYLNAVTPESGSSESESGSSESGSGNSNELDTSVYIFQFRSDGMVLTKHDGGSSYTWKTKVFSFPVPVCFRLVRATTADGTGSFTVFAGHDLSLVVSAPCSFPNGRAVRLHPNIFSREWCFRVDSAADLIEIEAAESPAEIY